MKIPWGSRGDGVKCLEIARLGHETPPAAMVNNS